MAVTSPFTSATDPHGRLWTAADETDLAEAVRFLMVLSSRRAPHQTSPGSTTSQATVSAPFPSCSTSADVRSGQKPTGTAVDGRAEKPHQRGGGGVSNGWSGPWPLGFRGGGVAGDGRTVPIGLGDVKQREVSGLLPQIQVTAHSRPPGQAVPGRRPALEPGQLGVGGRVRNARCRGGVEGPGHSLLQTGTTEIIGRPVPATVLDDGHACTMSDRQAFLSGRTGRNPCHSSRVLPFDQCRTPGAAEW